MKKKVSNMTTGQKDGIKGQHRKMAKDVFGRLLKDLRISVTDRCNFRCTYCMPAEIFGESYQFLPKKQILTFEEVARLTRIFVGLGTTKVRLTGGEPLIRSGMENLIAMLSSIEGIEDLTLTTNAYLLAQQAQKLRDAGLERVTVSLDSLDDDVFGEMNGRGFGVKRVLQGIQKATAVGLHPIKVNTVVQKGVNDHTIIDLLRYFKGTGVIVRFIEYMDVGNINGWKLDQVVPSADMLQWINAEMPLEPVNKNYSGEVADRYRYLDGSGEIGFISSVTEAFCSDCTRARLSTDGKLYTCLFAEDGRDLRGPMRAGASDADLEALITDVWGQRTDRYSQIRASLIEPPQRKVEMYQIGG
ncbi:GTP 3',8-cyclase MoaA [SAR202 cluster bacterium AC-647-N09_OGT_505m]|nr:GTP 3',8-cyclase MoaA [SAR202 cluster bacterium AC-647-N09_OGT_505m]